MTGPAHALVVGAGPAGCALALDLARAGRACTVLERERLPHDKVCGEFISGEAMARLKALGLDLHALGAAPIDRLRLTRGGAARETALPFAAVSLSRRALDEALIAAALAAGVQVTRGARVTRLAADVAGHWRAEVDHGDTVQADQAFLAAGKHDLRGWKRAPGWHNDLVAFKRHYALAPRQTLALNGCVELHLFDGGYAGLEPIEDGLANLCLVVRRRTLAALGGAYDAVIAALGEQCPQLAERLSGAAPIQPRALSCAAIPYGLVARPGKGRQPWRLGDQAAVIPSFAGDGLAIALHSAAAAARLHLAGGTAAGLARTLRRDLGAQVWSATALSQAMVRPLGQAAIMAAAGVEPRLMGLAARLSRVDPAALQREFTPAAVRA